MNNKLYAIISVLLILAGAYFYDQATKCQEPTKLIIAQAILKCAQSIDIEALRQAACQKIYNTNNCTFDEEKDTPAVEDIIEQMVKTCTVQALQDANMCTDKVTL